MPDESVLPELTDPPQSGARWDASCGRGPGTSWSTGNLLVSDLAPDSIVAHYGKQFEAAGWTAIPGGGIAVRSWTKRDSTGTVYRTTMSVTAEPDHPRCRRIELETTSSSPAR